MSQNKRDPMGADLLRQRRNLLITSLGLTAAQLAGATFQGSASIFGAGITFQEPVNLFYGAWVLWGYFLLRYWQYLGEESDLGISKAVSAWLAVFPGFACICCASFQSFWPLALV